MSNDDNCGYGKDNGEPCELPACRDDGRCWHHTETEARADGGRPTKLTYDRQEGIAGMIEDGQSISAAARSNGITVQTFFNWMERGAEQDEGIFADFFERITRARGYGESQYFEAIKDIARENGDVSTLLTLLKSRYPESWNDARRSEQTAGVHVHTEADGTTEIDPETLEIIDE